MGLKSEGSGFLVEGGVVKGHSEMLLAKGLMLSNSASFSTPWKQLA